MEMSPEEKRKKQNEYMREWYANNKERINTPEKRAREAEAGKRRRAANPGANAAYQRERYHNDPEGYRARNRARYVDRNKEKVALAVRKSNLKRNYGITPERYAEMLAFQKGVCAICEKAPNPEGRFKHLSVDHNHETGEIRSLLCNNCNIMIGHSQENPVLLHKGIKYLVEYMKEEANAA